MLLNDFFYIEDMQAEGPDVKATITINASHHIFDGHFPGQPVVPGVCMMQMVKEIIEKIVNKKTNISLAHELKFLAIIDPGKNNTISAVLKYNIETSGSIMVTASLFKNELVHFKFKGLFDPY